MKGGVLVGVDLAHEPVSIPAERWQRLREIVLDIGNDDCALGKELCIANTAPTRRNLYWAATAARILVQWTTGKSWRITLTAPFINKAAEVLVLVAGAGKANRVKEVLEGPKDPERLPIQMIQPAGKMVWIFDEAAARMRKDVKV